MKQSLFSTADKNRSQLVTLIADDKISQEDVGRAVELAGLTPSPQAWHHLVDRMLLWLGALLLAFALLFFVAYNWNDFGYFAKFALVEVLLIATVGLYWLWYDDPLKSRVVLLVASLLTGVLLALFGQTYQTGADPWELFFGWALLIMPWVIISHFSVMWIVLIALFNLSVLLYLNTFHVTFFLHFNADELLIWVLFLLNTAAWIVWEFASKRFVWLDDGWSLRLIALASGGAITWLTYMTIFEKASPYTIGLWLIWLIAIYVSYRRVKVDLFILTIYSFSVGSVLVTFLIDKIATQNAFGSLLLMGLIIVGTSTAFTLWLKSIHKEANHAADK